MKPMQELCEVRSEARVEVQTKACSVCISGIFCQHLSLHGMRALGLAVPERHIDGT